MPPLTEQARSWHEVRLTWPDVARHQPLDARVRLLGKGACEFAAARVVDLRQASGLQKAARVKGRRKDPSLPKGRTKRAEAVGEDGRRTRAVQQRGA